MDTTQSQSKQILRYLSKGRKLTAIKALELFSCFRLASRINDIKNGRFVPQTEIDSKTVERNGKFVKEYFIKRKMKV